MNESNDLPPQLIELENRISSMKDLDALPPAFDVSRFLGKLQAIESSYFQVNGPPETFAFETTEEKEGVRLGEYELIEVIGRGGSGTVYRARHSLLQREVAIKVLRQMDRGDETGKDDPAIERFLREIQVIGNIHSPHVVSATDARVSDGCLYLVMELVDGVTLQSYIQLHGTPEIDQARQWMQEICLGLHAAHQTGVIHRDIKPSNLMLTSEGTIKILDLGLASLRHIPTAGGTDKLPSLTSPSCIMGTVNYISPEQIEDARTADAKSDIYSLGCVFYFLLTGKPPFSSDDYRADVARLMAHVSVVPKPVNELQPEVPQDLSDVVARMLAKSPSDRFESVHELSERIR